MEVLVMFRWLQGFVIGGTLGYIAGVLFAPKSGEEMRRELAETSEDLITEASGYVTEMTSKGGQAITELKGRGERVKQRANTYLGEVKSSAKPMVDKVVNETKPVIDKVVSDTKRAGKDILQQSGVTEAVDKLTKKPSTPSGDQPMQNSA
jgi:gas vesicle protein